MTYHISTNKTRLDLDAIYRFLSEIAYWSHGIPRELFLTSVENSRCYGAYTADGTQAAFARVITDYATFGYIADVFVLPEHRGRGVSKQLVAAITEDPELKEVRRLSLITDHAHELYRQFGFDEIADAPRRMDLKRAGTYGKAPYPC